MATDLGQEATADTEETSTEAPQPTSRFGLDRQKVKLAALLLVVMSVQVAVGYMLLPDPAVPETHAREDSAEAGLENTGADGIETVEVELDPAFNPTNTQAAPGVITHVTFRLTAIVPAGQAQKFDQAVRKTHEARVRQAVVKVFRSSSLEDLSDPNFTVIKRKIRKEINKVLHKSYVIEVAISDFTMMQQ